MRLVFALAVTTVLPPTARAAGLTAAIADPHELVSGLAADSTSYRRLAVFPESLVFDVSWGLLQVGQATLTVRELVSFSSRPAYHIVSEVRSNGFANAFYKVQDLNESWLDAETLTSFGYSKKLREGRFFRDEWVLYDAEKSRYIARTTSRDGNYSVAVGTIPAAVQDVLSALYYVRSRPLEPGTDVVLDVNTKQNWPLVIHVVKREKVRTDAGAFETLLVEPAMRQEGIFIQKGRHLQIWLTDDGRRMPVLMKVEVFFGHVTARLSKML